MADTDKNVENNSKPQITMKVDGPPEDSKTETCDNDKIEKVDEFKVCSPSRIPSTATNSSSNPFASTQNKFVTRGILKPPQLSINNTNNATKTPFTLNPSRLNPFAAKSSTSSSSSSSSTTTTTTTSETSSSSKEVNKTITSQINGETPKFVPLIQSEPKTNAVVTTTNTKTSTLASSTFIFGQNLQDRVVNSDGKSDEPKPSTSLNSNGTSEMLFSSAIKNEVKNDALANNKEKETKSLSESAREYEESRAVKRKYEEVEVITGEENETNILNTNCKLFAFDKASGSWQERGRGVLRLNDFEADGYTQSRLVFRTTGIWKVVLNTKIWAEMTVEQASEKSVRFTALDQEGVIKIFLVMASVEESKHIYSQIHTRVQKEIANNKHRKPNTETDSGGN